MPKALLIHATDPDLELAEQPSIPFPVLGVTTVAALFPDTWELSVIDEKIMPAKSDVQVDLVGISSLTLDAPHSYELADSYRRIGSVVIMGGMHASAMPAEALEHCDAVVVGEAEGILDKVLSDFDTGNLKGIYIGKQVELSTLSVPRFDLLDRRHRKRLLSVQATRGCPHNCEFCSVTPFFGHKYRKRPVSSVVAEISAMLKEKGSTNIVFFVDDNIAGTPEYTKELLKALIPLNIKWGSFASVAMTQDRELMALARKSGCIELFIGFESIYQESLNASRKWWVKAHKMKEYVEIFHNNEIIVEGAFIFGHDNDEKDVFKKTVEFVQHTGIQVPIFGILTPYPATQLRGRLQKEGRLLPEAQDWRLYDGSHVLYRPEKMSPEELEEGFLWAKKYCSAPRSIFKRMFRAPRANFLMALALNFSMRGGRMRQIHRRWPKKIKGPLKNPAYW